ncbi:MAG: hypothetical protein NT076_00105 [Candidatus Pacearchaeota archaeon]|nr:hypothetical protein [Candidatus Pacearchaeota archaeon]
MIKRALLRTRTSGEAELMDLLARADRAPSDDQATRDVESAQELLRRSSLRLRRKYAGVVEFYRDEYRLAVS